MTAVTESSLFMATNKANFVKNEILNISTKRPQILQSEVFVSQGQICEKLKIKNVHKFDIYGLVVT